MWGSKFISWPMFFISFLLGLVFIYCMGPNTQTVYVYPSPENVNDLLFRDNAGKCFKFHMIDTVCDADASKIKDVPIQI